MNDAHRPPEPASSPSGHGAAERDPRGPSPAAAAEPDEVGRLVAQRYRLSTVLGRGARSVVWDAEDTALARRVAVKQIRLPAGLGPTDRVAALAQIGRRAQAVSALAHPGVIAYYDLAEDGGFAWLVMELVPWPTLSEVLSAHGALASDFIATIGLSALAGLDAAHELAIGHGDVNPANVLVATDGQVKLTDFGIARSAGGPMSGTPAFRSPEVLAGAAADPRSDLWGLGATLATAIRGRPPFGGDEPDPERVAAAIRDDPTPPLEAAAPLAFAVNGLLRKDPAHRLGAGGARQALLEAGGVDLRNPRYATHGADDSTRLIAAAAYAADPETAQMPTAIVRPNQPNQLHQPNQLDQPQPGFSAAPHPAPVMRPPAGPPGLPSSPARPQPANRQPVGPQLAGRPSANPEPARVAGPAPARQPAPRRRRPAVIAATAGLVAVLCAGVAYGAFWLTDTLTHRDKAAQQLIPTTSDSLGGVAPRPSDGGSASSGGALSTGAPSPPASATTAPPSSATPAGYTTYHDSRGFTVAAPQGWTPTPSASNHNVVDLNAPGEKRFLRLVVSRATTGSLSGEFAAAEKEFSASHQGYHLIQMTPGKFRGRDSIVWEFTFSSSGTVRHARYLDFIDGDKEYGVYVSAPETQFSSMDRVYETALGTISVP